MMEISRRKLLQVSGLFVGFSYLGRTHAIETGNQSAQFVSACTDLDGRHYVAGLNKSGEMVFKHAVESRGHSAVISHSRQEIVFFARRPDRWMRVLSLPSGEIVADIESIPGRHFYGHGCFNGDSSLLYVTENDYENNRGVIGIYDAQKAYRRIGELNSGGIGPHELVLLSDGNTLVVANGGIQTHPDYGRIKLNLETMAPNLSYIDSRSGELIHQVRPPHHKLSLRHLAVSMDDKVIVGAQYQGDPMDDHPLVYSHSVAEPLVALSGQNKQDRQNLNQYIASVSISPNGLYAMTSSPRGGLVSLWNLKDKSWLGDISLPDIGGVAFEDDSQTIRLSSGNGDIYRFNLATRNYEIQQKYSHYHWDNHLVTGVQKLG